MSFKNQETINLGKEYANRTKSGLSLGTIGMSKLADRMIKINNNGERFTGNQGQQLLKKIGKDFGGNVETFKKLGMNNGNKSNKKIAFSNEQLCEATVISSIPHSLIQEIFENFEKPNRSLFDYEN
jgi:uncharacterized ferredoxin-like protein